MPLISTWRFKLEYSNSNCGPIFSCKTALTLKQKLCKTLQEFHFQLVRDSLQELQIQWLYRLNIIVSPPMLSVASARKFEIMVLPAWLGPTTATFTLYILNLYSPPKNHNFPGLPLEIRSERMEFWRERRLFVWQCQLLPGRHGRPAFFSPPLLSCQSYCSTANGFLLFTSIQSRSIQYGRSYNYK